MCRANGSRVLSVVAGLALSIALVSHLQAQSVAVAEVFGRVVDPSGSAVPGAEVKLVQTETRFTRLSSTEPGGEYVLPNLPVGPYTLEVTASGFKTYVRSGILLQVGNHVSLNVTLELGALSQAVEVRAGASMVETKENTIGQVIDRSRVVDLPLNGRQATELILLAGAAVTPPSSNLVGSKYSYAALQNSVAGGQANATYYLVDGGNNLSSISNANMPFPFPEALQEFSVETSSLPARYGLHSGAVVNIVTKSGSNTWHGDLFEFIRNGAVNARNFFAAAPDTLKRNQFGGTIGGPVVKNKLFFFAGYQGTRNRQDPPTSISFVPTPEVLNGDFSVFSSGSCVSGGRGRTLIDPLTRTAFPNNQIPNSRLNPAALKISSYLPSSGTPCGRAVYGIPTTGDDEQEIGRVDWISSEKHSFFGRYFIDDYRNPGVFDGKNILTTTRAGNMQRSQSLTLGDTYTLSPNTLNSFHATLSRMRNNRGTGPGLPEPRDLGINIHAYDPAYPGSISVTGGFSIGCGTCSPAHLNDTTYQFADDVDLIRGRHQITFGAQVIRTQVNTITGTMSNGLITVDGSSTGDPMADFMLGYIYRFSQSKDQQTDFRQSIFGFYGQDTFRVNSRVTLNAGLRWDPYLPPTDKYGRGSIFDPAAFAAGTRSSTFINAPAGSFFYGDPGVPKSLMNRTLASFAPRVGLVLDPEGNGRGVLRIGGGILHDSTMVFFSERVNSNPPFSNEIYLSVPPGGLSDPFRGYPGGNPFPAPAKAPKDFVFPTAGKYTVPPQQLQPMYMAQWNVSYQRQIGQNWKASVAYLGNKTTHMWGSDSINPALYIPGTCGTAACSTTGNTDQRRLLYLQNPAQGQYYADIQLLSSGTNATYNGLLLTVEHRFSAGFSLLSNYTWSHCLSTRDFGGDPTGPTYSVPFNLRADYGNCNFDIRHNFNTSVVLTSPVKSNGVAGRLLGNWRLAPLLRYRSGMPVNATTGTDNSRTGQGQDRPTQVLVDPYRKDQRTDWMNRAAFVPNAVGTFGNVGRYSIGGPGRLNFDAALSRMLRLREGLTTELRAEAFNAINRTNLGQPTSSLSSASFGRILSAGDPRIFQFAVKLHF